MISLRTSLRRGFTLIELTVAMVVAMVIASLILALFNQQLAFLRIYQAQAFLTDEAPLINTHVTRLISGADRIRFYNSTNDAFSDIRAFEHLMAHPGSSTYTPSARSTASPTLVLQFRQPDGTMRASILSFETRNGVKALYYYIVPKTGALGAPQWFATQRASNVSFSLDQGVIRCAITGPASESITYAVTMQQ